MGTTELNKISNILLIKKVTIIILENVDVGFRRERFVRFIGERDSKLVL